jgi:hypothetical protein
VIRFLRAFYESIDLHLRLKALRWTFLAGDVLAVAFFAILGDARVLVLPGCQIAHRG